jgi:hypothetical protein
MESSWPPQSSLVLWPQDSISAGFLGKLIYRVAPLQAMRRPARLCWAWVGAEQRQFAFKVDIAVDFSAPKLGSSHFE